MSHLCSVENWGLKASFRLSLILMKNKSDKVQVMNHFHLELIFTASCSFISKNIILMITTVYYFSTYHFCCCHRRLLSSVADD